MALIVKGPQRPAAVCGDALPNSASVRTGLPRLVFWNEGQARASIRKLIDSAGLIYPGHDRPFEIGDGGKTRHLERASIRVFGWPESDEGDAVPGISYSLDARPATTVLEPKEE
jgi:glyoxylase-like metal-dependent hydrolase (beta-lactamase superfamily II)